MVRRIWDSNINEEMDKKSKNYEKSVKKSKRMGAKNIKGF
jgi:hypothetical protein